MKEKILVIGASGQIGTALLPELRNSFGEANVIAADMHQPAHPVSNFELLDALDGGQISDVVSRHGISQIYHLAAILSATAENKPLEGWEVNIKTTLNVLEVGRIYRLNKVLIPSSIAVFGAAAEKIQTSQHTFLDPLTVYGMSKAAAENWCNYYYHRYNLDVRSIRYPGVVGYQSMPGGGTTDYAVEIFHKAMEGSPYTCFLKKNTRLPMIYMDDALRATMELMEAPAAAIKTRTAYNVSGLSFTPAELVRAIQVYSPGFDCAYEPDSRQLIASSWPESIDDSPARHDWGWQPCFDLTSMTGAMWHALSARPESVQ